MNRKTLFLLLAILTLGTFLRLYKFGETLHLGVDAAMAYLLADRILNHNHILLVGPVTSLPNINLLPPTYYYLISILFFLFKSELSVTLVFTFMGIISPLFLFILAKEISDTKTALLSAFLYSINNVLVFYSRNIWEPHLVPILIIIAFYLFIKWIKRKNNLYLLLSSTFFSLSLMYASSLLLLPAIFIWTILSLQTISAKKGKRVIFSLLFFLLPLIIFYLPVIYFEYINDWPSIINIINIVNGKTDYFRYDIKIFFNSIFLNINNFLNGIFIGGYYYISLLFAPFVVIFYLFLRILLIKNLMITKILLILLFAFFISGFYQGKPELYRFAALFPFFLILIAFVTKNSLEIVNLPNQVSSQILSSFGVIIIFLYTYNNIYSFPHLAILNSKKEYHRPYLIADYIQKSSGKDIFSIYTITPLDKTNYYSVPYIYILEKKFHKILVSQNKKRTG